MADDLKMQMYEAQAMLIEKERELEEARRENQQLRLDNTQQRINQAIAATEKKFEDKLTELRTNAEERTQLAEKKMRQQFEETLAKENAALKESIANLEDKIKIDKKNYQENMMVMKQSTEENKIEAKRLLEREKEDRAKVEEKAALIEKANEETKKMVENMSIYLEYVSSELGFQSSALILGGFHNNFTDSILIFDSNENKWRQCKQRLPFGVVQHGSAILNGKIYFMGGHNNTPNEPLASCYMLGENGEWTKMADMNEKRTGISQSTIVFGSEIWVIGGWNGSGALKTVEKYNPQTNIWTKMADLNFERSVPSASIIGGKIFVSGGADVRKRLKSVEVYDPAKNKWEIFCDMPLELFGHYSIVEGTNLIIMGGRKSDETTSDEVWKIDVFDPKKEWIKMPSLKQRRYNHGAVKLSNGIMVFGGLIDNTTRIDFVEIFDGISWKEGPKLPKIHGIFSSFPLSIKTEKQLLLQLC